ncbi:helical backbone metal receptor [Chitinimonas koreensis]|uniref:helical backbone metal receptor n=1 Tax=Chitinimonas koreensis TaxID=356302 RepID=UPI00041A68E4|nr:helical backbone metal receptor [Chitinimonas koreensis]QNM96631.1 ABC transporter substrate-binding protein [Chitinimonas koreensis]
MRALLALLLALPAPAAVEARDDAGQAVKLAAPARRIVSLSPHATELLYEIGAGDRLVGRDGASDYPAAAAKLPAVGLYGAFNVEAIVALKPDLVVAWEGPQAGAATRRLRALGIPVFASQPGDVAAIPATLRALGTLSGQAAEAERRAARFETGWAALERRYRQSTPLSVVPQVGDAPAMTVNDRQFVAAAFRACNTRNPFGAERAAVPLMSVEALAAARPRAIVALATPAVAEGWLARWRTLPGRPALLAVDADTLGRPTSRILAAGEALCLRLDALRGG